MKDKKKNKKDIKRLMGKAGIILTAILAGLLCGWLLGAVLDKTGAGQAGSGQISVPAPLSCVSDLYCFFSTGSVS